MTEKNREKSNKAEERQKNFEKAEERQKKKEALAKERDSRVIIVRTPDTHTILDVVSHLDKGINALKKGLLNRYDAETVVGFMKQERNILEQLHKLTEQICGFTKMPYRVPKSLKAETDAKK